MFCANCGSSIDDDARFCNICGTPVEGTTPIMVTGSVPNSKKSFFGSLFSRLKKKKDQPPVYVPPEPMGYSSSPSEPPIYNVPPVSNVPPIYNQLQGGRMAMGDGADDLTVGLHLEMEMDDDVTTDFSAYEDETFRLPPEPAGRIVLISKENPSLAFEITLAVPVSLGRNAENSDIVLEGDRSISRKHCRLFKEEGVCYVEDLNSHNHTFVNGTMIEEPTALNAGDVLRVGRLELIVNECDMCKA